ncbi:MAG: hypothetical protein HXX10_08080 [Rhodoplanes sp.]|uniref:hypothetical protein n=1 Tax=Rhodoplanes sp. TaxID=1968906 RepID=UPI0017C3294A|nr:hypothetical protein [Rhodoplanes sp.]NVO13980.1 hypothetical protein [Rhodoplanes sp.]
MRLFRVADPSAFDEIAEDGMDFHLASVQSEPEMIFIVVGGRVAIPFGQAFFEPNISYLSGPIMATALSQSRRARRRIPVLACGPT